MGGSTLLLLLRHGLEPVLETTGDPLDATFSQRNSRFSTRVSQRRLGTTTQGRMDFEENDSVEPE